LFEGCPIELHKESRIAVCEECFLKEGGSTQKTVYHCNLCDKWFCETHSKPKFPYFVDWENSFDVQGDPEIKLLFHTEFRRLDGHPDFVYLRKNIEALEIEEKTRNELIKQAMDKMVNYPQHYIPTDQEQAIFDKMQKTAPSKPAVTGFHYRNSETKTTENKYNHEFWVPTEAYMDEKYRKKFNNAKTLNDIANIIHGYYRHHPKKDFEKKMVEVKETSEKKHWWQ
jgi:hypothetical protein